MKLVVIQTKFKLPSISQTNLSKEEYDIVIRAMNTSITNSKAYILRTKAGAFLQGRNPKSRWIFIEFWAEKYQEFVDYLNDELAKIDK